MGGPEGAHDWRVPVVEVDDAVRAAVLAGDRGPSIYVWVCYDPGPGMHPGS